MQVDCLAIRLMPLMADRSYGRVPVLFANAILRGTDAGRSAMVGLDVGACLFFFPFWDRS